jgi:hypothetical protein
MLAGADTVPRRVSVASATSTSYCVSSGPTAAYNATRLPLDCAIDLSPISLGEIASSLRFSQ